MMRKSIKNSLNIILAASLLMSCSASNDALDSALPSMGEGMAKTIGSGLTSALGSGLSVMGEGLSSVLSSGLGGVIGIVAQIPRLILDLVGNVKSMITGVFDSLTELISLRWIDEFQKCA